MLLRLSEEGGPKGRQIVNQVQGLIGQGSLRSGERLPSTRDLAGALGLHRSTVAAAYQELWALGWLELRPGAQPRVRLRESMAHPEPPVAGFPWAQRLRALGRELPAPAPRPEGLLSFADFGMDPRLMPMEAFDRSLRAVLRRLGPRALDYGDPQGQAGLRTLLAERLGRHGVRATPGEVLITLGAQQALDLALRGLTRPGDAVLVESPTYNQFLRLLELQGLRAVPAPEDLDGLEAVIERERPVLFYLMPSFQNPTGRSLDQAQRERLLALCGKHRLPILEDGFTEEMKYFGRPILPLKSMDRTGLVIYVGTFSKVLFPGIRLGWLAAPEACTAALTAIRRAGELCPPPLLQEALEDFLRKGHFEVHLARLHRRFRRRMEAAVAGLRRELDPSLARWEAPHGGYLLWLRLEGFGPEVDLEAGLARHGVAVRDGRAFYPGGEGPRCLRLSISNLDEAEIGIGLARLGRGLRALREPAR
ncbi:aminotransferase-like domain-containing protein [Mesoterricola silvestris]|uniref:GntR family transcriptional regulator n=1 Tax=Mesoterricola silvestris TaxID=2927979 RepID=A0AA48KDB9_9BACT|nr:PLP-dependent aminotransferase family protein [Mesoterricola silvestris]BDU74333.1 GntR family transcriptional regulator [Mesoterricola silvestris]